MVARTCLLSELVLPIIKYAMAPLEVGPELALNWEIGQMKDLWAYLLIDFEILN
jgi:hypothetical protein